MGYDDTLLKKLGAAAAAAAVVTEEWSRGRLPVAQAVLGATALMAPQICHTPSLPQKISSRRSSSHAEHRLMGWRKSIGKIPTCS